MGTFGIQNSVHDAALWYYSAFALLFIAAATAYPDLPKRWIRGFSAVVPALSVWILITLLLNKTGTKGPTLRFDNVPLLSHRPGNVCVVAAICLAWQWLVPNDRRSVAMRIAVSLVNLMTIIVGATQTRGGGLAAAVAIVAALALIGRQRRPALVLGLIATLVVGFGLASLTGSALHTSKRSISVSQLVQNVESLGLGSTTSSSLKGTENFRFALWSKILDDQVQTSHLVDGFGFGPNLAAIGGVNHTSEQTQLLSLRSAHNSLLDVFARTGIVGAALWLGMIVGWFRRMWRGHRRYRMAGNRDDRGLLDFCMVGVLAIILNCIFDPTLEGAQVAAVFFCLFGLGIIAERHPVLGHDDGRVHRTLNPVHAHPAAS
jgi:O-antigen ligase